MYTVYALKSSTKDWIYVGMTNNLERRLVDHQCGRNKSTKPYIPFILIYQETVSTRLEAREREKYWKSGIGKQKLKQIVAGLPSGR